jgi:hypothetical protein
MLEPCFDALDEIKRQESRGDTQEDANYFAKKGALLRNYHFSLMLSDFPFLSSEWAGLNISDNST